MMNLQENIQRIKEVMGLQESTIPNELKRRIYVTRIEKLINQHKSSSFKPDKRIVSSIVATCGKVAGELLPIIDDEEKYNREYDLLRNFLFKSYGQELTEYFEKRKEEYENREPSDVRYIFKKDYKGSGFSKGFSYFNDLLNEYGDWIDVDWDEIKNKLDKIDYYPEDTFLGWHNSRPLRISSIGDKGNDWGYNFFVIKSKKD
jgi:hypothetical protein